MSSLKRRALQIDDPLGPGPSSQTQKQSNGRTPEPTKDEQSVGNARAGKTPAGESGSAPRRPTSRARRRRAAAADKQPTANGVWREWSGITSVGSFRLPHELLAELGDTARELGLPVGLIATAAITQLLDQPAEQIAALVDRADDARIQGRRRARRPLPTKRSDA